MQDGVADRLTEGDHQVGHAWRRCRPARCWPRIREWAPARRPPPSTQRPQTPRTGHSRRSSRGAACSASAFARHCEASPRVSSSRRLLVRSIRRRNLETATAPATTRIDLVRRRASAGARSFAPRRNLYRWDSSPLRAEPGHAAAAYGCPCNPVHAQRAKLRFTDTPRLFPDKEKAGRSPLFVVPRCRPAITPPRRPRLLPRP